MKDERPSDAELREFHLGDTASAEDAAREVPLHPTAFDAAAAAQRLTQDYPLALADGSAPLELGPRTLLRLYREALARERLPLRRTFAQTVRGLVDALGGLLRADAAHGPAGIDPGKLSASLGRPAGELLDTAALSAQLRASVQRGPKQLDPERRARIERAREVLGRYLRESESHPELILVHSDDPPAGVDEGAIETLARPEAMVAAVELFDERTASLVETLRAVRVARLEIASVYDPARHDRALRRFDWQSCEAEELLLAPPIVVWESGRRPRGPLAASFSELLLSGRPIHVIVGQGPARPEDRAAEPTGQLPGLGYVAVAHRESFVLQATLARPRHLLDGLRRMSRTTRPAAALVAVPADAGSASEMPAAWLRLVAAHDGRGTPCFRYEPEAGESWAACFDLSENPQPERLWPEAGPEGEAFTYAHALALEPSYRGQFRVLAPEQWADDQVEISDYLAGADADRRRRIPYLWVAGRDGARARAVMTRSVAFACRDRLRAWRILQELSGVRSEHARRAAEAARREVEQRVAEERSRAEAVHAAELERVRSHAVQQAVEGLVPLLMELATAPSLDAVLGDLGAAATAAAPAPTAGLVAAPPATDTVLAAPATAAAVAADEPVVIEEPFIDSALCTTCNECINLNARMFKYNDDKQAVLADASAGSYEQLVRAAAKCPARCIHPGKPRPGDKTATAAVVSRAAAYN